MDQRSMAFPVLRINRLHIQRFNSLNDLRYMSQKFFDRGGFKDETYFIDSQGRKLPIEEITKVRRSGHPSYWFAPSPVFIVDIAVGKPTQLTFDEVKTLFVDLVTKNRWYTQGGESKEQFLKSSERYQSLQELMDNVSFYGKWQG